MMPVQPSLYAPVQRPYYIEAPAYRRNSAGIRVMHMLCHLLNRYGQDAYIYPTPTTNPLWHTPILTQSLLEQHQRADRKPITIYPEVVSGNPRDAGSVVRYLLNKPGFLGGDTHFPGSDLIYGYTQHLLPPEEDPAHVLFMPPIDSSIFHNENNPLDHRRQGWLIYPGRYPDALQQYKDLASQCTIITSEWPATPHDMAELFRRSERIYCFTSTAIATEAILCGCPAIVLPSPIFDGTPLGIEELGTHGLAFTNTPEAIAAAIAQLPTAQKTYQDTENRFWDQLEIFIQKTQAMPYTPVVTTHAQKLIETKNKPLQNWLYQRRPNEAQSRLIHEHLETTKDSSPHIEFIVVPGNSPEEAKTTQRNLLAQKYPRLSVHIADDAQATTLNRLASQISGDWICFVQAGTTLSPNGVLPIVLELQGASECRAVYTDEISIDARGELSPLFRPDLNLDMLLSWPAGMARHWIFRREVFLQMGGFDPSFTKAHEFELILRLIENGGLAGLAHIHEPLFIAQKPPLQNCGHEVAAIEKHLHIRGYENATIDVELPGRYRIIYGHANEPLVSIIVTALENPELTQRCLRSIIENTGYPNYEILLMEGPSQGTDNPDLTQLSEKDSPRIQHWKQTNVTTLCALQNLAAQKAGGEYLLFLNNSTAVLQEGWIDALLNHALRPEVGIVGAKVVDPHGHILHAGLVLGLESPAQSPFIGEDAQAPGEMHRLQIDQNYSAVADDCLMVRRALFEQVGGMEESKFSDAYSDADLCLKVGKSGHLIVWTPHVVILKTENAPKVIAPDAEDWMYSRWKSEISRDQAYNQNLSLSGRGFHLETSTDISRNPLPWRPLPTLLAQIGTEKISAHQRIILPAISATTKGLADIRLSQQPLLPAEMERLHPDAWIVQSLEDEHQLAHILRQSQFLQTFKIAEIGHLLPGIRAMGMGFEDGIPGALQKNLGCIDRLLLSSHEQAHALGNLHPDMRVLPTLLPPLWWRDLAHKRKVSERPRVGWAGNEGELEDLAQISEVVQTMAQEVDWIFLGACPDSLRPFVREHHGAVPLEEYASKLASLHLDLALAPLAASLFHECKGIMRLLEYGACGYPVVCSDLTPYRTAELPVTRVKNRTEDWLEAIRMHITDLDASTLAGATLRQKVQDEWMLEGPHLEAWIQAWLPR